MGSATDYRDGQELMAVGAPPSWPRALYEAGLAVAADLSLDAVLQRVVELARELSGARYGALRVLGSAGGEERFITAGITAEERERIGRPPQGRGLLGEVLRTGQPLRVAEISSHPASVGFPEGHPSMTSFLGVPIRYKDRVLGIIYLTDKQGAPEFGEEDAELLGLFAAQAAVTIENARLYEQVKHLAIEEERQRIAREMHDSLAQVLAYVNLKAGAVRRLLARGKAAEAEEALAQVEASAQAAYADVREAILGLRAMTHGEGRRGLLPALQTFVDHFSQQSGVAVELQAETSEEMLTLAPDVEVQLVRIIQEALTNVRKHAQATRAVVHLTKTQGGVALAIEDNGRGFPPETGGRPGTPRFGLQIMRERAEALGGTFAVESQPGKGARVTVAVPSRPPAEVT